jgi:hypothetical protein
MPVAHLQTLHTQCLENLYSQKIHRIVNGVPDPKQLPLCIATSYTPVQSELPNPKYQLILRFGTQDHTCQISKLPK